MVVPMSTDALSTGAVAPLSERAAAPLSTGVIDPLSEDAADPLSTGGATQAAPPSKVSHESPAVQSTAVTHGGRHSLNAQMRPPAQSELSEHAAPLAAGEDALHAKSASTSVNARAERAIIVLSRNDPCVCICPFWRCSFPADPFAAESSSKPLRSFAEARGHARLPVVAVHGDGPLSVRSTCLDPRRRRERVVRVTLHRPRRARSTAVAPDASANAYVRAGRRRSPLPVRAAGLDLRADRALCRSRRARSAAIATDA
jgi:hypothetical protein